MDQANPQGNTLLQQGIAAARAKRKGEAYQLLRQVVTSDPRNSAAWLWLGAVAPTPQEQLQAFEHVLALDPTNEKAQTGRRWALGRLGGGTGGATAGAPSAAPSGGMSSQAMLGMFGGVPGARPGPAAPPPALPPVSPAPAPAAPSGGMSSQDLLGMFGGGMPDAPARTDLPPPPPAPPPGLRAPEVSDRFFPPSGSAAPSALSAPAPRETGSGLDLATPQPFDPSMFGASQAVPPPPSSPLPPGAPGTPGGAEWRGYSDLQDSEAFNWDDSGLGLSATPPPPPGPARPEARPAETYPAAPSIFSDLDRDDQDAPRIEAGATVAELPPPLAERRGTPTLVLLGAVALIVLLLLIGILSALLANNTITLSATSGPEDTVQNFLDAHVSTRYTEASAYLVPALASEYRQIDSPLHISLPDPRRVRGLSARVAPLTIDAERAEVYGFFTSSATPAPETLNPAPWTFTLEKRETGWLITGITPP